MRLPQGPFASLCLKKLDIFCTVRSWKESSDSISKFWIGIVEVHSKTLEIPWKLSWEVCYLFLVLVWKIEHRIWITRAEDSQEGFFPVVERVSLCLSLRHTHGCMPRHVLFIWDCMEGGICSPTSSNYYSGADRRQCKDPARSLWILPSSQTSMYRGLHVSVFLFAEFEAHFPYFYSAPFSATPSLPLIRHFSPPPHHWLQLRLLFMVTDFICLSSWLTASLFLSDRILVLLIVFLVSSCSAHQHCLRFPSSLCYYLLNLFHLLIIRGTH